MTRCRFVVPVALLPFAACGAGARERDGGKFIVRYHPPPGALFRYEVQENMKVGLGLGLLGALAGDEELTLRIFFSQDIADPGGGRFRVTTTVDSVMAQSAALPRAMIDSALGRLRGRSSTVVFDDRMQVVSTGQSNVPGQLVSGLRGLTFVLPEGPVGKGDRWTVESELPLGDLPGARTPTAGRTTLTIKDVRVIGTDTTVHVTFLTLFPEGPIDLDVEGQRATVRLAGQVTGELEFSVLLGATLSGTRAGSVRATLSGGALGGSTATMSMNQRTTIKLLN